MNLIDIYYFVFNFIVFVRARREKQLAQPELAKSWSLLLSLPAIAVIFVARLGNFP